MTEATAEQVGRYILDGSNEDLRRLLAISQVTAETARRAFGRVGVCEGWTAIDCGCGPIGGVALAAGSSHRSRCPARRRDRILTWVP